MACAVLRRSTLTFRFAEPHRGCILSDSPFNALNAKVSRRTFAQGTALATGAFFINTKFSRSMLANVPASPATTPWMQPLAFAPWKTPIPFGQQYVTGSPIDESRHQRYDEFRPVKFYEMQACEQLCRLHPQLGLSPLSTYDGCVPGPTFMMRYGEPTHCRISNCLPAAPVGYGNCDVTTHVHNGHHAPESDGGPWNIHSPGSYHDHHWPNIYATDITTGHPDKREAKGTLWYHDHCLDFTSQNVYRGLTGFWLLFDDLDSGNENDPNPDAFRLPSGVPDGKRVKNRYDIPLVFTDRNFDPITGVQTMDLLNMDGILGDKFLVNGRVQPYFEVERRKYRFRLLDGGISRGYDIWLSNGMTFQYLANDGNMIPVPMEVQNVKLLVAERADIIVDFSQLPASTTELYLVNRAEQTNGRAPTGNTLPMNQANQLLKFIIRPGSVTDNSRVPTFLREQPEMNVPVVGERTFALTRSNGVWTVNGNIFDQNRCDAAVKINTAEIWNFSTAGGWAHPMHNHCEEPRYLSINGQSVVGTQHQGRKDVHPLYPGDQIRFYIKFRDWLGKYPMHCHNLIHEDHAMMVRWDITA